MSTQDPAKDVVVHLDNHRPKPSEKDDAADWRTAAQHLVAQNTELMAKMDTQSAKIDRLLRTVEVLTGEMTGYRTGKKDGAYARIARHDEDPDLLSAKADTAVLYPHTGEEIGKQFGLSASQVGALLGADGLKWAGDPDYQEMTRWKPGRQRFWHMDIITKLRDILAGREPDEFGITNKAVRSTFAKFKERDRQGTLKA